MDQIALGYERLIQRVVAWSQQELDVCGALIIGSRARTDHPADEWSDLDVMLFVRDPEPYAHSADWVAGFGPVWLTFVERTPDGGAWERRVLYEGGLDVDFALNPAQWLEHMAANGLPPEMADVVRRGVRVLADKDGSRMRRRFASRAMPSFSAPSATFGITACGAPSICGAVSCGGPKPAVMGS
jgi:aminoglycoside 6-adenylyltransferase